MCKVWHFDSTQTDLSITQFCILFNKVFKFLFMSRTLSNKLQGVDEATRRAQSFPVLLCHGKGNSISVCVCVCARARVLGTEPV